ncbi:thioredoxin family protein [Pseudomonas fluorescens]|uniref:thioredoxin family protein n=1 Tax=Pseudomonas fluorescens TaxID=294 RepID=UPI001A9E2F55|nr:thioredoxin family protein [Pseudomonas fluorescens]QTD30894.1 thioredoxin family protein [Pseudomonas fluorescens]
MTTPTRYSALPPTYQKVLKARRLVVLYFFNQHCGACISSGPVFLEIAKPFRPWMDIFMLDTAQSCRHPDVKGTPTVLFYKEGVLLKKLEGIGTEESLLQDFTRFLGKTRHLAASRKSTHDMKWLRRTLSTLCTIPRAKRWNFS